MEIFTCRRWSGTEGRRSGFKLKSCMARERDKGEIEGGGFSTAREATKTRYAWGRIVGSGTWWACRVLWYRDESSALAGVITGRPAAFGELAASSLLHVY